MIQNVYKTIASIRRLDSKSRSIYGQENDCVALSGVEAVREARKRREDVIRQVTAS